MRRRRSGLAPAERMLQLQSDETHAACKSVKDGSHREQAEPEGGRDVEETHKSGCIRTLELSTIRARVEAQVGYGRLNPTKSKEEEEYSSYET